MLPTPAWLAGGVVAASVAALASGGLAGAAMVAGVAGAAACILEFGGRPKRSAAIAAAALGAALIVARLAASLVVVGHGADGPPVLPAGTG